MGIYSSAHNIFFLHNFVVVFLLVPHYLFTLVEALTSIKWLFYVVGCLFSINFDCTVLYRLSLQLLRMCNVASPAFKDLYLALPCISDWILARRAPLSRIQSDLLATADYTVFVSWRCNICSRRSECLMSLLFVDMTSGCLIGHCRIYSHWLLKLLCDEWYLHWLNM